MKFIARIQHPRSLHFLKADLQWTADEQDALSFRTSGEAVAYAIKNLSDAYQVVIKFEDPRFDITLAPHPARRTGHPPSDPQEDSPRSP